MSGSARRARCAGCCCVSACAGGDRACSCSRPRPRTPQLFAGSYDTLVLVNGALVALLMPLVGWQLWRLRRNLKRGVFGSRLAVRLVLLFALVAVLPGALVYAVSVQFLGRSIESWFDVRVDRALEGGLNLGRSALDYLLKETTNKATQIALALAGRDAGSIAATLDARGRAGGRLRGGAVHAGRQRARGRRHRRVDAHAGAAAARRRCAARGCSRPYAQIEQTPSGACCCASSCRSTAPIALEAAAAAAGHRAGAASAGAGRREGAGGLRATTRRSRSRAPR